MLCPITLHVSGTEEITKNSALQLMFAAVVQLTDILHTTFPNIRVSLNYLAEQFTCHLIILLKLLITNFRSWHWLTDSLILISSQRKSVELTILAFPS